MSDNPNLVRATHVSGKEDYVPLHWLDEKRTPFPGQWTRVVEEDAEVQAPAAEQPTPAGDASYSQTKTANPEELKGAELDAALEAAGLPKTGKADEKRERLAAHQSNDGENA